MQQTYPNVGLTTYNSGGGPVNSYSGSFIPEWEFADSFTSVHGRHTLGFGVDYRHWTITRNLDDDFYGDWSFNSNTILTNNEPTLDHEFRFQLSQRAGLGWWCCPTRFAAPATPSPT